MKQKISSAQHPWKYKVSSSYKKNLRKNKTNGEAFLIAMFKQHNIRFLFQKSWLKGLDTFIISDFYLPEIKTVIEVDGKSHFTAEQKERDRLKDEYYRLRKFKIVRVNL